MYPKQAVLKSSLQSLIALLVGLTLPFLCTDNQNLGAGLVASYLYQIHYGRVFAGGDL